MRARPELNFELIGSESRARTLRTVLDGLQRINSASSYQLEHLGIELHLQPCSVPATVTPGSTDFRQVWAEASALHRNFLAGEEGFEPTTYGFGDRRSAS